MERTAGGLRRAPAVSFEAMTVGVIPLRHDVVDVKCAVTAAGAITRMRGRHTEMGGGTRLGTRAPVHGRIRRSGISRKSPGGRRNLAGRRGPRTQLCRAGSRHRTSRGHRASQRGPRDRTNPVNRRELTNRLNPASRTGPTIQPCPAIQAGTASLVTLRDRTPAHRGSPMTLALRAPLVQWIGTSAPRGPSGGTR